MSTANMVIVTLETLTALRNRVSECQTFEAFKESYLQYLDKCIGERQAEDERLKDYAREILGMNE